MSSSARELVLLTTPSPNSKWRRPANLFVDMLALVTVPILVINPVSVILREMPQMVLHPQNRQRLSSSAKLPLFSYRSLAALSALPFPSSAQGFLRAMFRLDLISLYRYSSNCSQSAARHTWVSHSRPICSHLIDTHSHCYTKI